MNSEKLMEKLELLLMQNQVSIEEANTRQLHEALAGVVMMEIADNWYSYRHLHERE